MILSLALIFLAGMLLGALCGKLRLPPLIGMLLAGILLGPSVANVLDESILSISASLRQIALIIILIKAGLTLSVADLKKVGRPAILMSFLPALFEIGAVVAFGPMLLGLNRLECAILGAVLGAVSPAVVVPKMVELMEQGYAAKRSIPQLILAGASLDDVFVIVLFTCFTGLAQGESVSLMQFAQIPISVVTGLAVGMGAGLLLSLFFQKSKLPGVMQGILLLCISFLLQAAEDAAIIPLSGLLGVMAASNVIRLRTPKIASHLSGLFTRLWIPAQVLLFVLVGAAVDVGYAANAGVGVLVLIVVALLIRSVGVLLCMLHTKLTAKERLFCVIAYLPKATVQAAIGGVPLAMGLACGQIVLTVAVVSILLTAPLGALGMEATYRRLLQQDGDAPSPAQPLQAVPAER